MEVFSVMSVFLIIGTALAEEGSLLLSCNSDDIQCLRKSTTTFLEKSYKGIPAYDIRAIDPLLIESSEFTTDAGYIYKHKNINVTGLRKQEISDFKMDTDAKSVLLTTKADLNIAADVEILFSKSSKKLTGSLTSHASIQGTATYGYELKTNDKGVRYFDVGPETITCSVVTPPELHLSPDLLQAICNDEDLKKYSKEKREEARAQAFCSIVKESYKVVIHNLRAAAKVLPASAFFKDI